MKTTDEICRLIYGCTFFLVIVMFVLYIGIIFTLLPPKEKQQKEEYSIELLNPEGEVRITTETKSDTISIDKVEEYILMDNL